MHGPRQREQRRAENFWRGRRPSPAAGAAEAAGAAGAAEAADAAGAAGAAEAADAAGAAGQDSDAGSADGTICIGPRQKAQDSSMIVGMKGLGGQ